MAKNNQSSLKHKLTDAHKEMIVALAELGISKDVIALVLFLCPKEQDILNLADYIIALDDKGCELTKSCLLEYLMDGLKKK